MNSTTVQHKNIIDGLKKGRRESFKTLFDSYFNALCSFGIRYIPDHSAIEDIVQETFVSFWEKKDNFDHLNAVKSFLYTSVRNSCLNFLKHEAIKNKHESALIYELESDHYFSHQLIEEEAFNQLHQEIKELPKSAQRIMILALSGLKNPEIAEELGITVNTVKTQKKLAYSKLKEKLSPVLQLVILSL